MAPPGDALASVSPSRVIREIAAAVPEHCHRNVIIGSLAMHPRR